MDVQVFSDVICPRCYVGKRRLERALAATGRRDVRVRWLPFQLNPQMPKEGMNRKHYRAAKFRRWERSLAVDAQLTEVGRAEDIRFAFEKIGRTPSGRFMLGRPSALFRQHVLKHPAPDFGETSSRPMF